MTEKSAATKIWDVLSNEPFNYSFIQVRHCFETFIGTDIPGFDNCVYQKKKRAKRTWEKPAEICAILSIRHGDREMSSRLLLQEVWKKYPEGQPDCDWMCSKLAVDKMSAAMELNRRQHDALRFAVSEKVKIEQLSMVEKEWDDRMITSYLKLKKLI